MRPIAAMKAMEEAVGRATEMGNSVYEYEYVEQYLKRSSFGLLRLDLWIIWKGIIVILKGGGH